MTVSPWWLAIVALITWSLGANYFPEVVGGLSSAAYYALGLASALLLFASILAHEFGHALVARRHGVEIEEIELWLLGGVSRMRGEAHTPRDELLYSLAGPLVTAVIAGCFAAAALLLPDSAPAVLRALVAYQAVVNGVILVFNMLPAFPLDGGRVLRSILWRRSGDLRRATERASQVGRVAGYLMMALGALELLSGSPAGIWLAMIGFFIVAAGRAEALGARLRAELAGVHARELMSTPALSIPADLSVEEAARGYGGYRYAAFPVVAADGVALGIVLARTLQALAHGRSRHERVVTIADRDADLLVGEEEDVGALLGRASFLRVGRAVVIDAERRPLGLLSISDVQRLMSTRPPGQRSEDRGAPVPF